MKTHQRLITTVGATLALSMVAGPAFAHSCAGVSKQAGAGSGGDGYFTAFISPTGEITGFGEEYAAELNPQDRPRGGWFTVHFIAAVEGQEPVEIGVYDVLLHQDLGQSPRFGGPGDSDCDGVGIDDLNACLDPLIEEFLASL